MWTVWPKEAMNVPGAVFQLCGESICARLKPVPNSVTCILLI